MVTGVQIQIQIHFLKHKLKFKQWLKDAAPRGRRHAARQERKPRGVPAPRGRRNAFKYHMRLKFAEAADTMRVQPCAA